MRNWLENLTWLPHNLIGHPAMALCQLVGLEGLGNWVHDVTIPRGGKTETSR